jgi:hypothetical protein
VSTISGGSVGAVAWAAMLADATPAERMPAEARALLGRDHLSPLLGALLFPDTLQRFLPIAWMPDRARALESSWESWRAPVSGRPLLAEPYIGLRARAAPGSWIPALALNSARAEDGRRVVLGDVKLGGTGAVDGWTLVAADTRASTAAHLTARFPYVSPAATVGVEHLVDGGYFETSGATTLGELAGALRAEGDLDPGHRIVPVVFLITNGEPLAEGGAQARPGRGLPFAQALAPLAALAAAPGKHGELAAAEIARAAGPGGCVRFHLAEEEVLLPLGWMMSHLAREEIDRQLRQVTWDPIGDGAFAGRACVPGGR